MIWNRQSVDWLANKHRTNGFASPEAFILHLLRAREECGKGFYRAPRRAKGRWFMDDSLVRKDANVNSQVASKCFRVYLWRTLHKINNNQQNMENPWKSTRIQIMSKGNHILTCRLVMFAFETEVLLRFSTTAPSSLRVEAVASEACTAGRSVGRYLRWQRWRQWNWTASEKCRRISYNVVWQYTYI